MDGTAHVHATGGLTPVDPAEAAAALAAARDAERRTAEAVRRGGLRYALVFAGVLALLVGAQGLMGARQGISAWAVTIVAVTAMAVAAGTIWRGAGVRPRAVRSRRVPSLLGMLALMGAGGAVSYLATAAWGLPWLSVVAAVASGAGYGALLRWAWWPPAG